MRQSALMVASSIALVTLLIAGEVRAQERYRVVLDLDGIFCRSRDDARLAAQEAFRLHMAPNDRKIIRHVGVGRCSPAAFTVHVEDVVDGGETLIDGVSFKLLAFPYKGGKLWSWEQVPTLPI